MSGQMRRAHARARVLVAGLMLVPLGRAVASPMGLTAAARVSEISYRYFLDDMLYTHYGDNRGFGAEHDLAQANIVMLFESFGLTVTLEPFIYSGGTYYNVVGTKPGVTVPNIEYIIGAHYDSVNNPGADDNASGVALVLEAARVLSTSESDYTIRFVAFDREEQGLYGSDAYVDAHIADNIWGMISADMVSYNTGADSVDIYGRTASNPIKYALRDAVIDYSKGLTASLHGSMDASDHAPFEWAGFEACLIIEDWGNPYYHTQMDSVDTANYIDYDYATQVTRAVVGLLVDEAGVDVKPSDGDFDDDGDVDANDSDQFELCFTGPGGGPVAPACFRGDFDLDDDIDCDDWIEFKLAWTDPGYPPPLADCRVAPPLAAPYPHDRAKNRYFSFDPNPDNAGYLIAFQVELKELELGACSGSGAPCRVDLGTADCGECSLTGEPCISASVDCNPPFPEQTCDPTEDICVNDRSGSVGMIWWVGPPSPRGNDVHLLVSEAFRREDLGSDWPAVVHVADCEVVPRAVYGVRAVDLETDEVTDELAIATAARPGGEYWADGVGSLNDYCTGNWAWCPNGDVDCPGGETCLEQWGLPDETTNFDDVTAAVFAFQRAPGLTVPNTMWVDMHGNDGGDAVADPPNFVPNFSDIAFITLAFQGRPYPFSDPAGCPDVGDWP